jgi:hypothetical protein
MFVLSMIDCFKEVKDPRIDRTKKHHLLDILVIAVTGVLSKCDSWVEIEDFGNVNIEWLKSFLKLENGIPSHDTFSRVFSMINPDLFQKAFQSWVRANFKIEKGEIISIDGKYFKASAKDMPNNKGHRKLLGTINAWASGAGVALAQKKADFDKNSEKKVCRELIELMDVEDCIITMDAAGCDAQTLNKVIEGKGDYCVTIKKNQ